MSGQGGSIMVLFGLFVFYSFIGWGIGALYDEPSTAPNGKNFLTPEDNNSYVEGITWVGDSGLAGPLGPAVADIIGFVVKMGTGIGEAFKVLTYSNPHVPYIVNLLIITPMNVMAVIATISLAKIGGS